MTSNNLDHLMSSKALQFASGADYLDLSLESLDRVDNQLATMKLENDISVLAAYVGEVIRSEAADTRWVSRPRRVAGRTDELGIGYDDWFADPYDLIRQRISDPSRAPLRQMVSELVVYFTSPTPKTEQALGWSRWFRFSGRAKSGHPPAERDS